MNTTKIPVVLAGLCAILSPSLSADATTVFPIADKPGVLQMCGGLAYDGANYLAALEVGKVNASTEVGAQLVSPAGALSGPLVNVGSSSILGITPPFTVAFGGGTFLEAWSDDALSSGVDIFGQRISATGAKVGSSFPLLASLGTHGFQIVRALSFGGGGFLVVWHDGANAHSASGNFYGQIVTTHGGLSGAEFLISDQSENGNWASAASDGTNFLVVWQSNTNDGAGQDANLTFGEFISSSGSAGSPFPISQTPSRDAQPLATAFDGTNYLVVWGADTQHDANGNGTDWTLYGRFVSPGGALSPSEVKLAGDPGSLSYDNQKFPNLAFDGQNYLLVWSIMDSGHPAYANSLRGQFLDRSANPVGSNFTALPVMGTNNPVLALNGLVYDGNRFALAGGYGRMTPNSQGDFNGIAYWQTWGVFIPTNPAPPAILTQPSNTTSLESATARLTVSVTGADLAYQWYKVKTKLSAGPRLSGVNSASLTITDLALSDAGNYHLIVTNLFGAVTSSSAILTVLPSVTITTEASPAHVASVTGGGLHETSSSVTVTATVTNDCFHFKDWTRGGLVVSTNDPYLFASDVNETLVANFVPFQFDIATASSPPNGGTTSGGGYKDCGSNVTVVATANTGFRFQNWSGGPVPSTNTHFRFTAGESLHLTANFLNITRPTLTITLPIGNETTPSNTVNLAGTAHDNVAVASVFYYDNGGTPIAAQTSHNGSNWSATAELVIGTNLIGVYAVDTTSLTSAVKTVTVIREPARSFFAIDSTDPDVHPQAQIAFDGNNYLVAYQIGHANNTHPVARFVSQSGQLVGDVLSLNPGGNGDPPWVAYDGTNYLTAWANESNSQTAVLGAFVTPDGMVGSNAPLTLSTTVHSFGSLVFGGGVYFMMWSDSRSPAAAGTDLFGAMVSPSVGVVVSDFEISPAALQSESGQSPAAFDGTNFLAVWTGALGGTSIHGRLITPEGAATEPFLIYTNSVHFGTAANAVVFDGTKYLVLFTYETTAGEFTTAHIQGRFITTSGEVLTNHISITADTGGQALPCVAFDGAHYLVTWNQGFDPASTATSGAIMARLLDFDGIPTTPEFTLFPPQGNKIPFFASVLFDGSKFFSAAGLGHMIHPAPNLTFTNGIISGAFIVP
jgi:hypothetical protein